MYKYIFILFLGCATAFAAPSLVPANFLKPEMMAEYVEKSKSSLSEAITTFTTLPKSKQTQAQWDEIGRAYFAHFCLLYNLPLISQDTELQNVANAKIQELYAHFGQLTSNFSIPQQRQLHYLHHQTPPSFRVLHGDAESKTNKALRILSWNVCMPPAPISLLFGGVPAWEERIEKMVKVIENMDADILCLQEVFDPQAANALYTQLKGKYAEFYVDIGPKTFTTDLLSVGLGSGLFIASKVPLSNCQYHSFAAILRPVITRGFFSCELTHKNCRYHLINTHLEASIDTSPDAACEAAKYRALQLGEILQTVNHLPTIVVGDMNICAQTDEETLLKYHFHSLNKSPAPTFCDFTGNVWPDYYLNREKKFAPRPMTLDYSLLHKNTPLSPAISAEVIKAHDVRKPTQALSDHQPLLTTIN